MLNKVNICKYSPDISLIHSMPAFIKIIWVLLFITIQFLCNDLMLAITFVIMNILIIELSRVKSNICLKVLWSLKYLFIFLILIYFYIEKDILFGIISCLKLFNIFIITAVLTITTSPLSLMEGIKKLFSPLKFIGISINKISFTIYLALRFIPTIIDVGSKIMKSQASRGVDYSAGKLKDKLLSIKTMLLPVFILTIKKADNLAEALEVRLYDIDSNRTYIKEAKIRLFDFIGLLMIVIILIFLIIRVW